MVVTRSKFILAEGLLQNQDGVIHVKATSLQPLTDLALEVWSHARTMFLARQEEA